MSTWDLPWRAWRRRRCRTGRSSWGRRRGWRGSAGWRTRSRPPPPGAPSRSDSGCSWPGRPPRCPRQSGSSRRDRSAPNHWPPVSNQSHKIYLTSFFRVFIRGCKMSAYHKHISVFCLLYKSPWTCFLTRSGSDQRISQSNPCWGTSTGRWMSMIFRRRARNKTEKWREQKNKTWIIRV